MTRYSSLKTDPAKVRDWKRRSALKAISKQKAVASPPPPAKANMPNGLSRGRNASTAPRGARKGINRRGPRVKAWEKVRAELKKRFAAVGITTCELHRIGSVLPHLCTYNNYLGFAHAAKRRKLSADDLYHVILICNNAHSIIEVWPAEEMERIVNGAIHARERQP